MDLDIPSYKSKAILEASTLPFADIGSTSDGSCPKEDPIAAQVWKMYTKQKDSLPNGARMENLSWRMVWHPLCLSSPPCSYCRWL